MLDSWTYDPHTPKTIDDIIGNHTVIQNTAQLIRENKASHLIFIGPQGCGKSLFLRIVLADMPKLKIDCTANSGLRSVRDNIRNFARGSKTMDGKLRWIVFEHAEALTSDTQAFLRRMLETTSASTRIIFECKDAGAISEPILSRSSIITFTAPEPTDILFEVQRRTDYKLPLSVVNTIVKYSYGNLRVAIMNALAYRHCPPNEQNYGYGDSMIVSMLASRPKNNDAGEWVKWAVDTESVCRNKGIDLRDILRQGWAQSPVVANTCAQWSRLGGTSPRTLFFECLSALRPKKTNVSPE
jgi:replication-associated recombination protein RarA